MFAVLNVLLLLAVSFLASRVIVQRVIAYRAAHRQARGAARWRGIDGKAVQVAPSSITHHGVAANVIAALFFVLLWVVTASAFTVSWNSLGGLLLAVGVAVIIIALSLRVPYPYEWAARYAVEGGMRTLLLGMAAMAVVTTAAIVISLLAESVRFFQLVSVSEFLFGTRWNPSTAIRPDQVSSEGYFGVIPLVTGTALITLLAMMVAVPVGLSAGIYTAEFASDRARRYIKPLLEILAGVPTVVFGFFAAITLGPFISNVGAALGFDIALESALAAGVVMGVMIIPYISSMTDDAIVAVPLALRNGSYALGATKYETITQVVLPTALPGISGGILLGVSRAIGETMIVVMAAGLVANLTFNPFEAVTTFTVQIVTSLVGDHEFESARTISAFALGLFLFCITLMLNLWALSIVRRYRETYQ